MATARMFADIVKTAQGGYALGAQGEVLTRERLAQLVRWNGRSKYYFLNYSAERWIGKVCWDCSGLVVWAMQMLDVWAKTEDYKAQSLWASKVVPIAEADLVPGSLVFHWDGATKRMSHVGVYVGNGKVVEAKGTKYGVIVSDESSPTWTHFGNLKQLTYSPVQTPATPAHNLIYLGSHSDEVHELQRLLNRKLAGMAGYVALMEDGAFGKKTDAAVRMFQRLMKLVVDGEVGPKTWGALLA